MHSMREGSKCVLTLLILKPEDFGVDYVNIMTADALAPREKW